MPLDKIKRNKLRILQISTRYKGGGAERCARELSEALIERGHAVTMWTANPEKDAPGYVKSTRSFPERVLFPLDHLRAINDWRHFSSKRLFKNASNQFDIVHFHNLHGGWLSIKSISAFSNYMPTVWTLHDEWIINGGVPYDLSRALPKNIVESLRKKNRSIAPLSRDEKRAEKWHKFLSQYPISTQRLICPSQYLTRLCSESPFTTNTPAIHVPNGCQFITKAKLSNKTKETCRDYFNIDHDNTCLLIIAANLNSPYKGIKCAIDAINKLQHEITKNLSVLIMGSRSSNIGDLITPSNIQVVADFAASDEKLIAAYRSSDLTIIPSVADNFPYTALESFACNTPAISFKVGGLTEMIQNNGILVEELSSDNLAFELEKIIGDKEILKHLGSNAQSWVEMNCDFNTYVSRIEKIYHESL